MPPGADPARSSTSGQGDAVHDCALVHAVELFGERWTLAIVRELLFGPRRFVDLRRALEGISANLLSQRLERLQRFGIVEKVHLTTPTSLDAYRLTQWGRQCEPALVSLSRWGACSPGFAPTQAFTSASLLLALKALFRPEAARGLQVTALFHFQPDLYRVSIEDGHLEVSPVFEEGEASLIFTGTPPSLGCALLLRPGSVAQLEEDGLLVRAASTEIVERFLALWREVAP